MCEMELVARKYNGTGKFNIVTGEQAKGKSNAPSYTKVFAQSLIKEADDDESIVAVNAAMPSGTGRASIPRYNSNNC